MTAPARFASPRHALLAWICALGLLAALTAAADFALLGFARARDARDFRRPLAQVTASWDTPEFSAATAKAAIGRAIELAPERPEPRVLLGHLRYRLGHWQLAITAYQDAIALGTQEAGIRQNIVWCYIELGDYDTAAEFGERALAEEHNGPLLHRYTGEALSRAGNNAEACGHFERALEASPEDRHLMYRLIDVYQALGGDAEAEAMEARISDAEARLGAIGNGVP